MHGMHCAHGMRSMHGMHVSRDLLEQLEHLEQLEQPEQSEQSEQSEQKLSTSCALNFEHSTKYATCEHDTPVWEVHVAYEVPWNHPNPTNEQKGMPRS